jgi:hypothetical protein
MQEGLDEFGLRHRRSFDVDPERLFPSGLARTTLEQFFYAARVNEPGNVVSTTCMFFVRYCYELDTGLIGR